MEVRLNFKAKHGNTSFGETVCVLGSCDGLGNWSADHTVPLHTTATTFPRWEGSAFIHPSVRQIEFKLVSMKEGQPSSLKWETFSGNRFLDIPAGTTEMTVSLDWDKRDTLFIEERRTNITSPMHQAPGGIPAYGNAALFNAASAPPVLTAPEPFGYDGNSYDAHDPAAAARPRSLNSLQPGMPVLTVTQQPAAQLPAPMPMPPMQLPFTGRLGAPRRVRSYSAFGNRYPLSLDPIIEEPNSHPPPQEDVYNYPVRPKRRAPSPQLRYSGDSGGYSYGYSCSSAAAESNGVRVRVNSPDRHGAWRGESEDEPLSGSARTKRGAGTSCDCDETEFSGPAVETLASKPHRGAEACPEHGAECTRQCGRRGARQAAEEDEEDATRPRPPPAPTRVFSSRGHDAAADRRIGSASASLAA